MKKVYRIIILVILASMCLRNCSFAAEEKVYFQDSNNFNTNQSDGDIIEEEKNAYGITDFLDSAKEYTDEDLELSNIFESSITGKFDNNKIFKILQKLISQNIKDALFTISGIIVIVIINSILKSISENLGNESVSKIANYIQYILIVTLLMKNFSNVINEMKQATQNLSEFSNSLIPLMNTLIIATGHITTSSVIEPILLLIVTFIGNFVTTILIPLILISTSLGIISKVSPNIQIDKLSKFMKKSSIWILTTILTIFISIASLEGGLTSNVDNVTKKAGKSVISAAVPVVGNILGDAIETISGYSNLIKNAIGVVGIVVIIGICIKPILTLAVFTGLYYLSAALCEPVADKNVTEVIEQMGETFKVLLGIMFTIATMLIVGIAIIMKITG